jgi:hypothetical protein
VTAYPGSVTIATGTLRAGDYTRLRAADANAYQVNSYAGATAWYGRVYSVPNALRNLKVTYTGWNSTSCSQTVSIWNWTTGVWVTLDSRTVGTLSTTINVAPGGTLSDYVSNASGTGDVAVRVRCAQSFASFYASGDLMKIVYDTP